MQEQRQHLSLRSNPKNTLTNNNAGKQTFAQTHENSLMKFKAKKKFQ